MYIVSVELAETYEKRSQGMAWDLDARELQNKKFQSMKMETHTKLCGMLLSVKY